MKLTEKVASILAKTELNRFPYFYLDPFSDFLKNAESKKILYFYDEDLNTMACKTWKNKFIELLQPMYPPLNKDGDRLDVIKEKSFLEQFVRYLRQAKIVHRITQPENFAIFHTTPEAAVSAPFGTYFLDLSNKSLAELFSNLHTKHRNVVRNAEKNNVIIKYGPEHIDAFYELYAQTMQRSGMYCQSLDYFKAFCTYHHASTVCGVAYHNDIAQGGVFMPYTQHASFYLYGASVEKPAINGIMNYLHWNTIRVLKEKGVKRYDFVGARLTDVSGTKLQGIQQFKKRFGCTLEKGFLWKLDLDQMRCSLFDGLVKTKLKLKGIAYPLDIIDQENKKLCLK